MDECFDYVFQTEQSGKSGQRKTEVNKKRYASSQRIKYFYKIQGTLDESWGGVT